MTSVVLVEVDVALVEAKEVTVVDVVLVEAIDFAIGIVAFVVVVEFVAESVALLIFVNIVFTGGKIGGLIAKFDVAFVVGDSGVSTIFDETEAVVVLFVGAVDDGDIGLSK